VISHKVWGFEEVTTREQLKIVPVLSWTHWQVKVIKACSPLALFVGNKNKVPDIWPTGMHGVTKDAPRPLLAHAAEKGFFQLKGKILEQICVEIAMPPRPKNQSLGNKLFAMIKFVLKCTDDKASQILEDRLDGAETSAERDAKSYIAVPGAARGMDADGKEDLEKFQEADETKGSARESIARKLRELNGDLRRQAAEKQGVTFKGDKTITVTHARECMPPGFRIYRDNIRKRWQALLGRKYSETVSGDHSE